MTRTSSNGYKNLCRAASRLKLKKKTTFFSTQTQTAFEKNVVFFLRFAELEENKGGGEEKVSFSKLFFDLKKQSFFNGLPGGSVVTKQ